MTSHLRTATESLALGLGGGASLVLLVDYTSGAGPLCEIGGGCDVVKSSSLAAIAGIPTPVFGLAFFAVMWATGVLGTRPGYRRILAGAGALVGLVLLGIQAFALGAFCKFCVVADLSALALFASCVGSKVPARRSISFRLASVALALFFYAAVASTSQAPGPGDSALTAAAQGQTTIVEFVDFRCPACRALHTELRALVADFSEQVRIVRKHVPLPRHAHSMDAARAYCCADEVGLAEPMADRLFAAADLRAASCEDIAVELGADRQAYRECLASPRPGSRIAADGRDADALQLRSLPTILVGDRRFEGVPDSQVLRASIESAVAEL